MNMEAINGILRAVVPAICAYAVGKGWISTSAVADITGAAVAIAAAIWSVLSKKQAA